MSGTPTASWDFDTAPHYKAVWASWYATGEIPVGAVNGGSWWANVGSNPAWLAMTLRSGGAVTSYSFTARADAAYRVPKTWTFEGSNDATNWTVLDTRTNITWTAGENKTFTIASPVTYAAYRINVSAAAGTDGISIISLVLNTAAGPIRPPYETDSVSGLKMMFESDPAQTGSELPTPSTPGRTGSGAGINAPASTRWLGRVASQAWMNTNTLSLEAWVRPTNGAGTSGNIFDRDNETTRIFQVNRGDDGSVNTIWWTTGGVIHNFVTSANAIPSNVWSHVVVTFDGTTVRVIVNGVVVGSAAQSGALMTGTCDLLIGAHKDVTYTNQTLRGSVDSVRVYAYAMTPGEAATRMAASLPTTRITAESMGTSASTAVSTSFSADITTAAVDSVVLLWVTSSTQNAVFNLPGWTKVQEASTPSTLAGALFWRTKVAGDTTFTGTMTSGKGCVAWTSYANVDRSDPIEGVGSLTANTAVKQSSSTTITSPTAYMYQNYGTAVSFFANRTSTAGNVPLTPTTVNNGAVIRANVDNSASGSSPWVSATIADAALTATGNIGYAATIPFAEIYGLAVVVFLRPGTPAVDDAEWEASDITGLTDGTAIPANGWPTKNGRFNVIGGAPTYRTNVVNGKPVVRFAGNSLTAGPELLHANGEPFTMVAVVRPSVSAASQTFVGGGSSNNSVPQWGVTNNKVFVNQQNVVNLVQSARQLTTVPSAQFSLLVLRWHGGSCFKRVDVNRSNGIATTNGANLLTMGGSNWEAIDTAPYRPGIVTAQMRTPAVATTYSIGARSGWLGRAPKNFKVQGSNNWDGPWTTVDAQANVSWSSPNERSFTPEISYRTLMAEYFPSAWWRLGETSGAAVDASGNNQNGTVGGTIARGATGLLTGDADTCYDFDGTSGRIDTPAIAPSAYGLTLSAVISPDAVNKQQVIYAAANEAGGNELFMLRLTATNKVEFRVKLGGAWTSVVGATSVAAGSTYTVGARWDTTTAKVYLNGVEDGSVATTGTMSGNPGGLIGAGYNGALYAFFDGKIDEVAHFSTALDPTFFATAHTRRTTAPTASSTAYPYYRLVVANAVSDTVLNLSMFRINNALLRAINWQARYNGRDDGWGVYQVDQWTNWLTGGRVVLGAGPGGGEALTGDIAYLRYYKGEMDDATLTALEQSLMTSYAITPSPVTDRSQGIPLDYIGANGFVNSGWYYSYLWDNAVGGSNVSWSSGANPPGFIKFGSKNGPVTLSQYALTARTDAPTDSPSAWVLEGSNDEVTWTTIDTQSGQTWTAGQQRIFRTPTAQPFSRYRLSVSATQSGGWTSFSEFNAWTNYPVYGEAGHWGVKIRGPLFPDRLRTLNPLAYWRMGDGAVPLSYYNATLTSSGTTGPVDNDVTTFWETTGLDANTWYAVQATSGATISVGSYILRSRGGWASRAPKDWTIEGSNDGASWTVIDTQSGVTSWNNSVHDAKMFSLTTGSGLYKYVRIKVSAVNGGSIVNLSEFTINGALSFVDSGSYGRPLTMVGYPQTSTDTPGTIGGQSMAFNSGAGLQGSLATPSWMNSLNAMSIAAWFRTSTTGANMSILSMDNTINAPGDARRKFALYLSTDGKLVWMNFTAAGGVPYALSPLAYNDGNWHLVVATRNTGTMAIYVDGALTPVATQTASGAYTTSNANLSLGWIENSIYQFVGKLDEVAVFDYELTPAQQRAIWLAAQ